VATMKRRPSRAAVDRALHLWKVMCDPPDRKKEAADPGSPSRSAAAGESREYAKNTPGQRPLQRGRR